MTILTRARELGLKVETLGQVSPTRLGHAQCICIKWANHQGITPRPKLCKEWADLSAPSLVSISRPMVC